MDLGVLYGELQRMDQSLDYTLKAAKIFIKINNKSDYIHALNNIGDCYKQLGEYKKGLDALSTAYDVSIE